jgi:nifR3 family TIM-barrel protein
MSTASAVRFASPEHRATPVASAGEFAPLVLGGLAVWPPVVLAPMAGVTNYPFRKLARRFGAGLYVSEMITARGYLLGNRLTRLLASSRPDEKPRSVQIYGTDPVDLGEMARQLVDEGVEHIDMNFGCPVPKVTRTGGGSAVTWKPRLLARLVRAAVKGAGAVPVTIKVRKGLDEEKLTYLDSGAVAEAEGAAAIGLHARTAAQLYSGVADWNAVAELVARVKIPVLGNGDVWECFDALALMRRTGCAGVIVGRGCLGRPWLFAELAAVFDGREPPPPPAFGAIRAIMDEHARLLIDFFGEVQGMRQMRKWCAWYTQGFPGSARARAELVRVASLEAMHAVLGRFDADLAFPEAALRVRRGKGSQCQVVALPEGYLEQRDDDTPPRSPHTPAEIAAYERALDGG